jgi:hypothetical protein
MAIFNLPLSISVCRKSARQFLARPKAQPSKLKFSEGPPDSVQLTHA